MNFWQKSISKHRQRQNRKAVGLVLLLVGIVFLLVGIKDGQLQDMFQKAVTICLECIGIG